MVVVFDMDNTLVLWTNSRRDRAIEILREHNLRRYFKARVCREGYDPDEQDVPTNVRRIKGGSRPEGARQPV
jgi:phosphoglycolate phosphatase-like HAD superfamily hydrolase